MATFFQKPRILNNGNSYVIKSVSPLLISNDEVVTVTFESSNPSSNDWIGAYSPPNVDITTTVPIKYGCCTGSCDNTTFNSYLTSKAGSLYFNLTNVRSGVKFYYFTGSTESPNLVNSSSSIVYFKNINEPLKNRIVATVDPNIYQLLWSSANATTPFLQWGLTSGHYPYHVNGTMSKISRSELCGAPANETGWFDLGIINKANITGIINNNLSNKNIYYRFGDFLLNITSKEFRFHVPPATGHQPANRSTTVALLADLGVGTYGKASDTIVWDDACQPAINTTLSIAHFIQKNELDAIIHTGDISYANGYLATWDFFLDMITPISSSVLYFTTMGNHESDYPGSPSIYSSTSSGGECTVVSASLLPLPSKNSIKQPWWSYEIGLIHFVAASTEHNYTIGSEQYKWLENDLLSINRSITPWVLFTGHRPMYVDSDTCCYSSSDVTGMTLLRNNLEPLLYKYQVNLGFTGHFHNLQRQAAIYRNKTVQHSSIQYDSNGNKLHYYHNPNATVWMVIGSAGNGPDYSNHNYSWSERSWNDVFGYAVVSAVNATTLHWNLMESSTNRIIEQVVITQDLKPWTTTVTPTTPTSSTSSSDSNLGLILGLTFGLVFSLVFIIFIGRWYYLNLIKQPALASKAETPKTQEIEL